ncbi:MAG: hypothetical protein WC242_04230 [Candidatus Paceibacterota bacterium]|jgi:hypothetical protein
MTANERKGERKRWQEDREKYWPLDRYESFTSWDDVLENFDPNKIGMEAAMGILHGMARLPILPDRFGPNIEASFRRLAFYLHCAEYGGEGLSAIHGGFVPEYYLRSMAYDRLVSSPSIMLHNDLLRYSTSPSPLIGENLEIYKDFVELLHLTLDFFSRPGNRPVKPKHKKDIASFFREVLGLDLEHSNLRQELRISSAELDKNATEIREKAIKATVNCRLYELIVEKKLFEALDSLLQSAFREEEMGFSQNAISFIMAIPPEKRKEFASMLSKIKIEVDSASSAWLALWAMKNAPEEETHRHHRQMTIEDGSPSFRPDIDTSREIENTGGSDS